MNRDDLAEKIRRRRAEDAEREARMKGPPAEVVLGPLTSDLVNAACWKEQDQYPAFQMYADECEALLGFARSARQLNRYLADLTASRRQRNAALGELRVGYYLVQQGFKIVEWKPIGFPPKEGEFLIRGSSGVETFVEVKGPSWQSELSDTEIKAGRTQHPKDLYLEARAVAPWRAIQFGVEKAYEKFRGDIPNLLVIADDLFVSLQHGTEMMASRALYEKTYQGRFTTPKYENLGGAGIFWIDVGTQKVLYGMKLFLNPFARVPLANDLEEGFR